MQRDWRHIQHLALEKVIIEHMSTPPGDLLRARAAHAHSGQHQCINHLVVIKRAQSANRKGPTGMSQAGKLPYKVGQYIFRI